MNIQFNIMDGLEKVRKKDFIKMLELGLIELKEGGRSRYYILKQEN